MGGQDKDEIKSGRLPEVTKMRERKSYWRQIDE